MWIKDGAVERAARKFERARLRRAIGGLVDEDGEGQLARDVGIEMRRVAGEHHGAARGLAAHHLQPRRVTGREMERNPRGELLVAVMEHHPVGVELAHQLRDRLAVERRARGVVAHYPAGGACHLGILQMEMGIGEG